MSWPAKGGKDELGAHNMPRRVVIALDVDCFYPQAEMLRSPWLRGKAVGVRQKHLVISCSYEARARGVSKGDSVGEVVRKCPDIVLLNGEDLSYYSELSDGLRRFVECWTDGAAVERLGLDELFVDASELVQRSESGPLGHVIDGEADEAFEATYRRQLWAGSRLAADLRRAILEHVGLTTSAGISTNKLLAKVVCSRHKPNDQTTLVPTDRAVRRVLHDDFALAKVPGIGCATRRRLGCDTIGELRARWTAGSLAAAEALLLCSGIDESPVRPSGRPLTVGVEESFWARPLLPEGLERTAQALCDKLLAKLAADQRGAAAEAKPRTRPAAIAVVVSKRLADDSIAKRATRCRRYSGPHLSVAVADRASLRRYLLRAALDLLQHLVSSHDRLHVVGLSLRFEHDQNDGDRASQRRLLREWLVKPPANQLEESPEHFDTKLRDVPTARLHAREDNELSFVRPTSPRPLGSDADLDRLMEMGFDEAAAFAALRNAGGGGGRIESALDALLGGGDDDTLPSAISPDRRSGNTIVNRCNKRPCRRA